MSALKFILKTLLPLVVIAACFGIANHLMKTAPKAQRSPQEKTPLYVDVHQVELLTPEIRIPVRGQLQARWQSQIASEVSGVVLSVNPNFQRGSIISAGETLVSIDKANYQTALSVAEADLASAQLELELERSRADAAAREWKELGQRTEASALTLRKPQLARAESQVAAAQSRLTQARRDLERTEIKAPFTARIAQVFTERGSVLNPGSPIAQLFPIDTYEITLPVSLNELPWVPEINQAKAFFPMPQGEQSQILQATILRTAGEVDASTRTLDLIAEVRPTKQAPPTEQNNLDDSIPQTTSLLDSLITPGLFLDGYIEGKNPGQLLAIPRAALISSNEVLLVDKDKKLKKAQITPVWKDQEWIYASEGLDAGDQVVTTTLDNPIEGISVELPAEPKAQLEELEEAKVEEAKVEEANSPEK